MIINLVVAKDNDEIFNTHFVPSVKRFNVQCFQIGDKPDENGNIIKKSITEKYHIMTKMLLDNNVLNDDSVIVFVHEDVNIFDNHFIDKINMIFSEKPDVGVLGVIGTKKISKEGWWLDENNIPVGHIIQGIDGKNITEGEHKCFGTVGYIDDCVSVEGCVFAVRGSLLKSDINFDIENFKIDRDLYAMDISLQALLKGYKVAVADILVYHRSNRVNQISDTWKNSKIIFNNKYKNLNFPIESKNIITKRNEIMEVEI